MVFPLRNYQQCTPLPGGGTSCRCVATMGNCDGETLAVRVVQGTLSLRDPTPLGQQPNGSLLLRVPVSHELTGVEYQGTLLTYPCSGKPLDCWREREHQRALDAWLGTRDGGIAIPRDDISVFVPTSVDGMFLYQTNLITEYPSQNDGVARPRNSYLHLAQWSIAADVLSAGYDSTGDRVFEIRRVSDNP